MNEEEKDRLLRDHPEYANLIHYVRGSSRQRGFWRVIPFTYANPTVNQLKHRRDFAQTAYNQYGKTGFINNTPVVTHEIGKILKGKKTRRRGLAPKERDLRIKLSRLAKIRGIRLRIKLRI